MSGDATMNPFLRKTCFAMRELIGLAMIAMLVIGASRLSAEEPLPSQDEAIARAVENHPDIVAAKAKLALAESELNGKRMDVSRQVLQSYSNLKNLEAQMSAIKAKLDAVKHEFGTANAAKVPGAVTAIELDRLRADVQAQEAALVQTMLQREQTEKELRLLLGSKPAAASGAGLQNKSATRQLPQGPKVDQIRAAMNARTSIDVADQPLIEQLTYLSDKFNFAIQIHPDLPKKLVEGPIRMQIKDIPLPAAFQAIEDFNDGRIQFVVRDYGIVLMDRGQAESNGFMPLLEFVRESAGKSDGNGKANPSETATSGRDPLSARYGSSSSPNATEKSTKPSNRAPNTDNPFDSSHETDPRSGGQKRAVPADENPFGDGKPAKNLTPVENSSGKN
jgi:hypothetical protein